MPRYKVKAPTFCNSNLQETGAEIEYAGWPGSTLEPIDDVAKRIKEYFVARRHDRRLPRVPDLAMFAVDTEAQPDKKPDGRKINPVKDN